jgi:hypothetical protein
MAECMGNDARGVGANCKGCWHSTTDGEISASALVRQWTCHIFMWVSRICHGSRHPAHTSLRFENDTVWVECQLW